MYTAARFKSSQQKARLLASVVSISWALVWQTLIHSAASDLGLRG